ncbi:MAG TPA: hypothetical protein VFJ89_06965 [Nocardioides sp.]|jgi:hypothetical protein|nr:hypothetical protein [Nocardioides sp.]
MRTPIRTSRRPDHHRPRERALTALRHDFVFAAGVVADSLRNRPFTS